MICQDDECLILAIHEAGTLCRKKGKPRGRITPELRIKLNAGKLGITVEEYVARKANNEMRCSDCRIWKDKSMFNARSRRCKPCLRIAVSRYYRSPEGLIKRRAYDLAYYRKKKKRVDDAQDVHQQGHGPGDGQDDPPPT
jgi:hypothetical protein